MTQITEPQRNHVSYLSCQTNCTICGQQIVPELTHRFRARKSCIFSSKLVRRESRVLVFFLALNTFIYLPQPPSFLTYFLRFIPSPPRFVIQLFLSIPDDRAIVGKRHGYLRIIPLACVGYEVVNSKRGAYSADLAITISYRKSANGIFFY